MKRAHPGELEELITLTAGTLYDNTYGLNILDRLEKQTGQNILISWVHRRLKSSGKKATYETR